MFLVVEHEDEMEIDNENACFHKRPLQNTEHTYHFKVYAIRFYIVERQNIEEAKRNKTKQEHKSSKQQQSSGGDSDNGSGTNDGGNSDNNCSNNSTPKVFNQTTNR